MADSNHPTGHGSRAIADRRVVLARLALRHVIHSPDSAAGKCFVTSLEFAHAAREIEDVTLLRWRVRTDPDFNEHWAVRLSNTEVLDVTRVQIDGRVLALKQIASYPGNYHLAGEYPASMLLVCCSGSDGLRVPVSLSSALAMRWAIYRHDIRNARPGRVFPRLAGWVDLSHFFVHALASGCIDSLARRRRQLVARLAIRR